MRKYFAFLLCLAVLAGLCGCGSQADTAAAPTPTPTEKPPKVEFTLAGAGTEEDPYQIGTVEELLQFAGVVRHDEQYFDYYNCYYRLTADLELNDCSDFDSWLETPPENVWTPIGNRHSFRGVFDGNGHTIRGLYIDAGVCPESGYFAGFGLFENISGGTVMDLTIENAFIYSTSEPSENNEASCSAGILAAQSNGTIRGCRTSGVIVCGRGENGGVVGFNSGEVSDCSFEGQMLELGGRYTGATGGIAGWCGGSISDCEVAAQLLSKRTEDGGYVDAVGGIVGSFGASDGDEMLENCTFRGEVLCAGTGGGIVGSAIASGAKEEAATGILRNCTNFGTVTARDDAGGIVGHAGNTSGCCDLRVEGCTNHGEIHSQADSVSAVGGIVGYISTSTEPAVIIADCINEADLAGNLPGGIVGRVMQGNGVVRVEGCTNKGAIEGSGFYAGGILCHIQQMGTKWNVQIDRCVNEGDILSAQNVGGIVCFAFDIGDTKGRALTISDCTNRGDLYSDNSNCYMGGILGVDSLPCVPVTITGCRSEGDLVNTNEAVVDAETLSGRMFTLSRTAGGIVGVVGTAPYLSIDSGERSVDNIGTDDAYLTISDCTFTGHFSHQEAHFADDVDEALLEAWRAAGEDNMLNFFIALEGGVIGAVTDDKDYSVHIENCTYENAERAIDDWNRF